MKKHILKILLFIITFIILLGCFSNTLRSRYAERIAPIEDLYLYPKNTIDILFVGGSRIHADLSASIMWEDHGIASYILWGIGQPMWNTYFYVKEALKTQIPKLVVLDVCSLTQEIQYDAYISQISNVVGLRFSIDKIMAVIASVPGCSRANILFGFPNRYIRHEVFEKSGRKPNLIDKHSITCPVVKVTKLKQIDVSHIDKTMKLPRKQEKYFLETIKLLKEKNIPILLVAMPQLCNKEDQMLYNSVTKIASENNIPFLNFNLLFDETSFDSLTDMYDYNHCNYKGMKKVTKYFEQYLQEHYNLPDRRNDPNQIYRTWQSFTDECNSSLVCKW